MLRICRIILLMMSMSAFAAPAVVKTVITASPGGGLEVSLTHLEKWLLKNKNISMVKLYKPGSDSLIGLKQIEAGPTDGSMIGLTQLAALAAAIKNKSVDVDLISATIKYTSVLTVSSESGIVDYADFVVKARRGGVKFGYGSPNQKMQLDYLTTALAIKEQPIIVPYKGAGPAVIDLLGGHIDAVIVPYSTVREFQRTNRIKVIATFGPVSEHPTLTDLGKLYPAFPDFGGYGIVMPKNTDPVIAKQWRAIINSYLTDLIVQKEMDAEFATAYPSGEAYLKSLLTIIDHQLLDNK